MLDQVDWNTTFQSNWSSLSKNPNFYFFKQILDNLQVIQVSLVIIDLVQHFLSFHDSLNSSKLT